MDKKGKAKDRKRVVTADLTTRKGSGPKGGQVKPPEPKRTSSFYDLLISS
jgi:hypothetical protein